jgi:hypothetical protein
MSMRVTTDVHYAERINISSRRFNGFLCVDIVVHTVSGEMHVCAMQMDNGGTTAELNVTAGGVPIYIGAASAKDCTK